MLVAPKKIRRWRRSGELSVEQVHDRAVIAAMLDKAGRAARAVFTGGAECFLISYWGNDPVGIAGLETAVDAALIRPLFVLDAMRRRGIGVSLVRAARVAARARGARTLYVAAPARRIDYFSRLGFAEGDFAKLLEVFGQASMLERTSLGNVRKCRALRLDISRDGLIER
jgi:N-acetylglutamate synthase-like GNAT family acetyltransferase